MNAKLNPSGLKRPFVGPRQLAALRYIASRKTSPTREEIGRRLGITKVSAHLLVHKLAAAGLVGRVGLRHRSVWVTPAGLEALR